MSQVAVIALSKDEARSLTDEVKRDAERLWRKLVELYDGQAHLVLGYSSWGSYFKAEFGQSERHGYRLLDAGRALEVVASDQMVTTPNEAQARELVPLAKEPELMKEAWEEAIQVSNGHPTAAVVKNAVTRRRITEGDRKEMCRLRESGKTVDRIAEITGWSKAAVSRELGKVPDLERLSRRRQAATTQTRTIAKIQQLCRDWDETGDESYIPAPEIARRIRVLDNAIAFLVSKRDSYKEAAPNGSHSSRA